MAGLSKALRVVLDQRQQRVGEALEQGQLCQGKRPQRSQPIKTDDQPTFTVAGHQIALVGVVLRVLRAQRGLELNQQRVLHVQNAG